MIRQTLASAILVTAAFTLATVDTQAQSNPCNPCGAKAQAANPCGAKASSSIGPVQVDARHASHGTLFRLEDSMGRNQVSFASSAPLEDILGVSNEISGYVAFDPNLPQNGARGRIQVPVASLGTGIPLRDEHLQSANWLDASAHPTIDFELESLRNLREISRTKDATTWSAEAVGPITIHGRTRTITADLRLTYLSESDQSRSRMPGNLLAARAKFQVELSDFGVQGAGGVVGSKVSNEITVEVSVVGSDEASMASNPCGAKAGNPCGAKAVNPCGAKAGNPCGAKAANPCAGKKS